MKDSHRHVHTRRVRPLEGFWYAFGLLLFLSFLAACRQAPSQVDQTSQLLGEVGGSLILPGGAQATFSKGFLRASADVTLSLSDTPEPYPSEVAEAYPEGAAEPAYHSVSVSLPSAALGDTGTLSLRLPVSVPRLEGDAEERFLAEVHLLLPDGQHIFNLLPYARVAPEFGPDAEGSDTVVIRAAQLT
jgi:hypothetical protein